MPESVNSMATRFEDLAATSIREATSPRATGRPTTHAAVAHAAATLALALRVRDLTDTLSDLLGDGSHLDGLKAAVRDELPFAGRGDA